VRVGTEQLSFRNALRADRSLASRYAQLKTDLAEQHRDDREAYSLAKLRSSMMSSTRPHSLRRRNEAICRGRMSERPLA